jgi:hypothetical protein
LKKKEPIPTIVVYFHPHHIEKQQSSDNGVSIHTLMHQWGTRKDTNQEVHGGLPTLHEDIRLEQQSHGNIDMMWRKLKVERTTVGHLVHLPLGWMDGVLGTIGHNSQSVISYGLFSCFRDETCLRGVECNIPREVIWGVIWEVPNGDGVHSM